jgi:hypothetical protein
LSRKKIKFFNAILCEHVVAGANNKQTLVNVYSGDVIVRELPAHLTFGVYLELASDTPERFQLEIRLDQNPIMKIDAEFNKTSTMNYPKNLSVPLITVAVNHDLMFSVIGMADEYANTSFIKKRIYKGTIPNQTKIVV